MCFKILTRILSFFSYKSKLISPIVNYENEIKNINTDTDFSLNEIDSKSNFYIEQNLSLQKFPKNTGCGEIDKISAIYKIINPYLKYDINDQNLEIGYHGTSWINAQNIAKEGFYSTKRVYFGLDMNIALEFALMNVSKIDDDCALIIINVNKNYIKNDEHHKNSNSGYVENCLHTLPLYIIRIKDIKDPRTLSYYKQTKKDQTL